MDSSRQQTSTSAAPSTPASPPTHPGSVPPQQSVGAVDTYQHIAETVGGLPSMRVKDNVVQGLCVLVGTVIAGLVGLLMGGFAGLMIGVLIGMFLSLVLSGIVLMVLGWMRFGKRAGGNHNTGQSEQP